MFIVQIFNLHFSLFYVYMIFLILFYFDSIDIFDSILFYSIDFIVNLFFNFIFLLLLLYKTFVDFCVFSCILKSYYFLN